MPGLWPGPAFRPEKPDVLTDRQPARLRRDGAGLFSYAFFNSLLILPEIFIKRSRRNAFVFVENDSINTSLKGTKGFVDFVLPALCSFNRFLTFSVLPIYQWPFLVLSMIYT